ncbi:transposase, partial [Thiolapillus sp.]|uniref:transposase n=1 Tax=Thiolapillus sp. TaxID=2017437 RepID=UPI003AF51617
ARWISVSACWIAWPLGFTDHRNPESIEHSVRDLVAQRVYGLALGYEDLNDLDDLRKDSTLALLVGKRDLTGEWRVREQDRGNPLAASSTLNRLELGIPKSAISDRYKRIAADNEAMDRLLVDLFLESYRKPPRKIWLDLDATDDPLHGQQEGRFFHCQWPIILTPFRPIKLTHPGRDKISLRVCASIDSSHLPA